MLIGFLGNMGQGKTLSMTVLGRLLAIENGVPLYANYALSGIDFHKISTFEQFWDMEGGVVLLDELWLTMESRQFKSNVGMTQWLNQTRKKNLIVMYTTQHPSQVDIRVRRATDWVVFCEKKQRSGIWLTFVDYQSGVIGKKMQIEHPEKHYNKYNTYEVLRAIQ